MPFLLLAFLLGADLAVGQRLPLQTFGYEPNVGQLSPNIRFFRRSDTPIYVTRDSVVLRNGIRIQISGMDPRVVPEGDGPLPGRVHVYRGNAPSAWRTNVRTFQTVRWSRVLPGIDARYSDIFQDRLGRGRLTVSIQPGAGLDQLRIRVLNTQTAPFEGPGGIWFVGGQVPGVFTVSVRAVQLGAPQPAPIEASLKIEDDQALSIRVPGRNDSLATELEIEFPNFDINNTLDIPPPSTGGDRYAFGSVEQPGGLGDDGKLTGACSSYCADSIVVRVDQSGRAQWVTVLAGGQSDYATRLQSGGPGVMIAGSTESGDFPITPNAPHTRPGSSQDVFLALLDQNSGELRSATFAGLGGRVWPAAVSLLGEELVVGGSLEPDDRTAGSRSGYVLRWNPRENRFAYSRRMEASISALVSSAASGMLYFASSNFRSTLAAGALDAATGSIVGTLAQIPADIPAAYFAGDPRLLVASDGDLWVSYTLFINEPFTQRAFAAKVSTTRGQLLHQRLISNRGEAAEFALTPQGNVKLMVRNPDPLQVTTPGAGLVAGCPSSVYFIILSPANQIVHATYAPEAGFDFATRNEPPALGLAPPPRVGCIASTAGRNPSPVIPGQLITITGGGFGPASVKYYAPDQSGKFPLGADGLRVRLGGLDAPILAAARGLIAVQAPFDLRPSPEGTVLLEVFDDNQPLNTLPLNWGPYLLLLFDTGVRDNSYAIAPLAALNQDGSVNSKSNPAPADSIVTVFGTGLGPMNPPLPTGGLNPVPPAGELSQTPLLRACRGCDLLYLGSAPGLSTGVVQLNIQLHPSPDTDIRLPDGSRLHGFTVAVATTPRSLSLGFGAVGYVYVK